MIAGLLVSTIAFFVAVYFIKRTMDEHDIPKGTTRSVTIFVVAAAISYGAGWLVGLIASP